MSSNIAKSIVLVGISMLALAVAFPFGPLGSLPTTFAVSDGYLVLARNHELYLGAIGFLGVFLANMWVKAKNIVAVIAAIIGGSLFFVLTQAEDPEFFSYLGDALIGFHTHYLASGLLVAAAFVAINYRQKKG